MELLVCLGQALWDRLSAAELRAYWTILRVEINSGTRCIRYLLTSGK
jgi:hypothetical protein